MKRNGLAEIKNLDIKALFERVKKVRLEISEGRMDKNMNKLKDLKTISKKRKDLAQILTIIRQKQLLEQLESRVKVQESSEINTQNSNGKNTDQKSKVNNEKGVVA